MLQLADVGCPALAGAAELRTLSFRKAQKRGGSLALCTTGPWPLSLSVWHRSVPAFRYRRPSTTCVALHPAQRYQPSCRTSGRSPPWPPGPLDHETRLLLTGLPPPYPANTLTLATKRRVGSAPPGRLGLWPCGYPLICPRQSISYGPHDSRRYRPTPRTFWRYFP